MHPITRENGILLLGLCLIAALTTTPVSGADPTEETAAKPAGRVALARFTTGVENREPIDSISFLESSVEQVFFFTDLRNMNGDTVTHRWEHAGAVVAEVPFDVRSDRYRVWSSKQLRPDWLGEWRVSVVNAAGEVLASEAFTLQGLQR